MRVARYLAILAGISLAEWDRANGAVIYQTVARTGQQAPGTATGTVYANSFSTASINSVGQVIFSAVVNGSLNNVLYAGSPGALQLVARTGDQVPGLPAGVRYLHFHKYDLPLPIRDQSVINDAGQIVFQAVVSGPNISNSNYQVVVSGFPTFPQLVAQMGTQAPGTPPGVLYERPDIRLNEAGQVALYEGNLSGPGTMLGNRIATFIGAPGAMQLAARDGDPAPGTIDNYGGNGGSMGPSFFNDAGLVVFTDTLSGPDVVLNLHRGALFAGGVGTMQLVARGGNPAPGAPAGVNYGVGFSSPSINDSGQIAFINLWATGVGGVDSSNDGVIYAGPIGAPQLIAREGDPASGAGAGVNYSIIGQGGPILNDAGGVYFSFLLAGAGVSAANDEAHFAGPWNAPQLIAREGDPAPGTPTGVTFAGRFQGSTLGFGYPGVSFNDLGQVAMMMQLAGPGVTAANDGALYLFDPILGPVKIAREGDQFDIGGGVMRTIADFGVIFNAGHNDDFMNGLSNTGTLVFGLKFTDNTSGIYTATIPVPEPSAFLMSALVCLVVSRRFVRSMKQLRR
jgi:hypothetical protein